MNEIELKDLTKKWSNHLDGFYGTDRQNVAILLENQYLNSKDKGHSKIQVKVPISLTKKVYSNLMSKEIVSIQPMLNPTGFVKKVDKNFKQEPINAVTRAFKAFWRSNQDLDTLADDIALEIDREVINDLYNNSGSVGCVDFNSFIGETFKEKSEEIYNKINEVSELIKNKTGNKANFIVASPEIVDLLTGFRDLPSVRLQVKDCGMCGKFKIYKDPLFPKSKILLGYKGAGLNSDYAYCPYVPFELAPLKNDGSRTILTRYGKKLLSSDSYVRIEILNFPNELFKKEEEMKEDQLLAQLIKNQEEVNKSLDTPDSAQFKKLSLDLVKQAYQRSIFPHIVSCQVMTSDTDKCSNLQFVENKTKKETHQIVVDENNRSKLKLQHIPSSNNIKGNFSFETSEKFSFEISSSGLFEISPIKATAFPVAGAMNYLTGELYLAWNVRPNWQITVDVEYGSNSPSLEAVSSPLLAITRKLKAFWTFEAQQDLRSQFNIDAEQELLCVLAQEYSLEQDREVLADLRNNASTKAVWDFNSALGDTIMEKYESLYVKIVEVSEMINAKTKQGVANFIVTSPEIASIFETATAGFTPSDRDTFTSSLGVNYVGLINNRWKLYKDPLFPADKILLGYKGESSSGYCYAPHSLTTGPAVLDTMVGVRKNMIAKYGKKFFDNGKDFYAVIDVKNFMI